jgi:hypothetical protein
MTVSEPSSPDNDRQEPGLWLWQGEAPAQREALPPIRPLSRIKRMTHLLASAAQRSMRLALNGPALIGLALIGSAAWATLYLLPVGEPVRGDTPVAAAPTVQSLGSVRPAKPVPPAAMPSVQLGPAPPPVSIAKTVKEPIEPKTTKSRAWHRLRHVKKAHAAFVHLRTPAYSEPCRYQCDWAGSITWHGGGY